MKNILSRQKKSNKINSILW